jgi:sarcosine oxidase subunit beta
MLERFKEELGQEIDYRKCGYLFVLTDEEDVLAFQHNVKLQHDLGVETEWLGRDEICKRLPMMNFQDALAGTFHKKDGLVDPNSVVMGYINAAQKLGVKTLNNVEVTGIRLRRGKVEAVETTRGVIITHMILNAAGPWSGQIGRMAGVHIPVSPIRRQMLTLPLKEIPGDFPFVIDFVQSLLSSLW